MNPFNNLSIDSLNNLIFIIPGFFFYKLFKHHKPSDFEYGIYSIIWGIALNFVFRFILPTKIFSYLLENVLVGIVAFSVIAIILAIIIQMFLNIIRKYSNGSW